MPWTLYQTNTSLYIIVRGSIALGQFYSRTNFNCPALFEYFLKSSTSAPQLLFILPALKQIVSPINTAKQIRSILHFYYFSLKHWKPKALELGIFIRPTTYFFQVICGTISHNSCSYIRQLFSNLPPYSSKVLAAMFTLWQQISLEACKLWILYKWLYVYSDYVILNTWKRQEGSISTWVGL